MEWNCYHGTLLYGSVDRCGDFPFQGGEIDTIIVSAKRVRRRHGYHTYLYKALSIAFFVCLPTNFAVC